MLVTHLYLCLKSLGYILCSNAILQMDLMALISSRSSECLNESDEHPFSHCLKPDNRFLESDCDEQLIIVLAFKQPIKLHTLQIVGRNDGVFYIEKS